MLTLPTVNRERLPVEKGSFDATNVTLATVGARLLAARRRKGIGQEELGAQIGVHAKTVSRWENDKQPPELHHIEKLAGALGVSVDWLRHGERGGAAPGIASLGEASARYGHPALPRQVRLMALDFEREALQKGADEAFMRYVRTSFDDPDYVALFAGGPDESPMTDEEAIDEMKAHIAELRAILKRRLARARALSGKLAPKDGDE